MLRLALLAALRDGDFGDRQSVREERRDDRQEGREERRDERQEARGDRGDDHELLRLAVLAALRDGDFGDRQSVREERRDDRQEGARNVGMIDERRAAIGETTTSCYALRFLRRFATGILEIGSRSERNVATIDKRGARNVGMIDERRAAIGETTTSCYALRFLRRFATGILEIGSRSERNVATIDKRGARNVGMSDERCARRSGRRPRVVTPCGSCGASRRGFWRSAVGQRGTSRRSTRGREKRQDERRDAPRGAARWGAKVISSGMNHCC